jgi:hypothetical protein
MSRPADEVTKKTRTDSPPSKLCRTVLYVAMLSELTLVKGEFIAVLG